MRTRPSGSVPTDPKQGKRIVDPSALARARLVYDECAACGAPATNPHHIIPRSEGGDDLLSNLVGICGNGTMRCHGAMHGSPYTIEIGRGTARVVPKGWDMSNFPAALFERRDQQWVANRLGTHIALHRPDVIDYVKWKLGRSAGTEYLHRHYGIVMT